MIRDKRKKRVLLKISGEALMGEREHGIDPSFLQILAENIKHIHKQDIEVAIVLGGGNLFRGMAAAENGMERSPADFMGMLATIMNGIALQDALEQAKVDTRLMSALELPQVAEHYIKRRAERHLEKGRVVICVGGSGNPYFTTDSAGVLRALELSCDMMIKATKVDGVYDKDPKKYDDAVMIEKASYKDVIHKEIRVMDHTAITLAKEGNMVLKVVNLYKDGAILRAIEGKKEGTTIE